MLQSSSPGLFQSSRLQFSCWGAALLMSTAGALAYAAEPVENYPSKPIRFIVPFTAGGVTDRLARTLAQGMQETWKQAVVVENRAGAGGTIGADIVAKAPGDGYTIVMGTHATHAINVTLFKKLPYDAVGDFVPITLIATVPNVLLVNPAQPVNNVQELVKLAKSKPGVLSFTSAGIGTSGHMSGELFKMQSGIDMLHVPGRGPTQAIADVVGGHVDIVFDSVALAAPLVQAGKLKALAVTSRQRSATMPELPTMIEAGVPDYEITLWFSVFAPKGTPAPIADKLNKELVRILQEPSLRAAFVQDGVSIEASSADRLATFQKAEIVKWASLIKATGATAQ